jgi:hypothetical protein
LQRMTKLECGSVAFNSSADAKRAKSGVILRAAPPHLDAGVPRRPIPRRVKLEPELVAAVSGIHHLVRTSLAVIIFWFFAVVTVVVVATIVVVVASEGNRHRHG